MKYGDTEFLSRTYEDILYRDIIARLGIKDVKSFQQLCHYVFSCFTGDLSYHALSKTLGIKSPITVKNYLHALESCYLIFELYKYDYSLKKQYTNSKKVYVIDNGMRNSVAFAFSSDRSKHLENLVFNALRRQGKTLYMFRETRECDFLVEEKGRIVQAIQVCYELTPENMTRELSGLQAALDTLNCDQGLILTYNQDAASLSGSTESRDSIEILPVWKWML